MRRPGRSWRHSSSARCRPLVSTLMPLPDPWWNVPGKPFLSKSSLSSSAQLRWRRNRCAPDDVHGDGGSSWTCLHSQQVRRRLAVPRSRWIAGKAFSAASANNRGGTISRRFPGALVARSASGLRKRRAGGKALAPALCDRRGGRWAGWLRRQVHEVGRGDAVAVQYQPGPLVGQLRAAVLGLLGERAGHRSTGCCRVGGVLAQAERAGPMIFRHLVGQLLRPAVRTGI